MNETLNGNLFLLLKIIIKSSTVIKLSSLYIEQKYENMLTVLNNYALIFH